MSKKGCFMKHCFLMIFTLVLLLIFAIPAFCADENRAGGQGEGIDPVILNFDDAEIREVIRTFAEILQINCAIDTGVQGKVTIHTAAAMKKKDLFAIFFKLLEINGITAVKDGPLYRVSQIKDTPRLPVIPRLKISDIAKSQEDRIIIQIIPIHFMAVDEMAKLLTPFISKDGTLVTHKDSGSLILVDRGINIRKALKLASAFDVDMFEKIAHRFYRMENIDAEDIVKTLKEVFSAYGPTVSDNIKFVPLKKLNGLFVFTKEPRFFGQVEKLIRTLDKPLEDTEPRIFIYSVKNGEAKELADLIGSVFSGEAFEKTGSSEKKDKKEEPAEKPKTLNTPFGNVQKTGKKASDGGNVFSGSGSGTLKGKFRIVADETRNTIIVEALPADYRVIEQILQRLDVLPRQVLIETTIAEISLDDSIELGLEWSYSKGSGGTPSTSLLSASAGAGGLQYIIGQASRWTNTLRALATKKKVNILSSPSILASDNKEAKINISTEIPVASAQYYHDSGSNPVTETNIQYRNTGVILSVKPHINEQGLVSLDISQEVSEESSSVQVGNQSMPSFFKRSVDTTLTVMNGQTIVIGGLMRETKTRGKSGVPCLGSIPIIEYLVGTRNDAVDKTELIIMMTPRVIANLDDVDAITSEFKQKAGNALKRDDKPFFDIHIGESGENTE